MNFMYGFINIRSTLLIFSNRHTIYVEVRKKHKIMYTDCCPFPQHKRVCITCTSFYELLFSQSTPKYKNMNMCMYMCISMVSDVLSKLLKLISSFISYEFNQNMTNCRISHNANHRYSQQ